VNTWATSLDTNDGDTSYASIGTALSSLYLTMDPPLGQLGAISSVTISAYARGSNNAAGTYQLGFSGSNPASATVLSGNLTAPGGGTYALASWTSNTNPSGGTWSWSDITNIEAVVRSVTVPTTGTTKTIRIGQVFVTVNYTPTLTVAQGADNVPVGSRPVSRVFVTRSTQQVADELAVTTGSNAATITAVVVRGSDTAARLQTDVSGVTLYRDNGDGVFNPITDTQIGVVQAFSGQTSGSLATFSGLTATVAANSTARVWVVYTMGSAAVDGDIVGSQVNGSGGTGTNGTDITVGAGQSVATFANIVSAGAPAGQTLQVDATGPSVAMTAPAADGTVINSTLPYTVAGTASDTGSGVSSVIVKIQRASDSNYWNGLGWQSAPASLTASTSDGWAHWTYTFNFPPVQAGNDTFTLTAIGADVLGNSTLATRSGFRIDNVAPSAAVTDPVTGATLVGATKTVSGTATDAGTGVAAVAVRIMRSDGLYWNGSTWSATPTFKAVVGTTSWTYSWSLDPGQTGTATYSIDASATDSAGNSAVSAAATGVRVDNVPPTLISASAPDPTHVDMVFSEAIATATVQPTAFALSGGLSVSGATLEPGGTTVRLSTSPQSPGLPYTASVTAGALTDVAGNPNAAPYSATFAAPGTRIALASANAPAAAYVSGGNAFAVDGLTFQRTAGTDWVGVGTVTVRDTGTAPAADVTGVWLYRDADHDGRFVPGTDVRLNSVPGTFSGTDALVTLDATEPVAAIPTQYFVVYGFAASATSGHVAVSRVVAVGSDAAAVDILTVAGNGFTIDTLAPPAPVATVSAATADSVDIAWTPVTDAGSGLSDYGVFRADGTRIATTTATTYHDTGLTPNREYSYYVRAYDAVGNFSQGDTVSVTTSADPALTTTATANPAAPDGTSDWYVSIPTVTLTPSPAVPADTFFAWDGSALTTYTGPTQPIGDGVHTLAFWSQDKAGSRVREATEQVTYRIDTTRPSACSTITGTPVSTTALAVSWATATDAGSGIDHYDLYVDGVKQGSYTTDSTTLTGLVTDRVYVLSVTAVDRAGLAATANPTTSATPRATATVRTIATTTPPEPDGANGWYTTVPTVTLSGDPSSPPADIQFSWDGSPLAPYTVPTQPPGEGAHTLSYRSVEKADPGNREATQTVAVQVDTSPPSAPTSVSALPVDTTSIALDWTLGSDAVSGIDHYVLYVNGVPEGSYITPGTTVTGLDPDSLYAFSVVSVDAAGLQSGQSPVVYATPPAVASLSTMASTVPTSPDGADGWYVTMPTVSLGSVPASVAAVTYFGWDGSALTTYTGPVTAPSDGTHTLSYWSVDEAHQHAQESTRQVTLKIDTTPDVRLSGVEPTGAAALDARAVSVAVRSVELTWTPAAEPYSGIDHYEVWDTLTAAKLGTSSVVGGLTPQTAYGLKVYAVNRAGVYSSESDTITVTTSSTPLPDPPAPVAAQAADPGTIDIGWQPASVGVGSVGYHVWRSGDGSKYSQVATLTGQYSSSFVDTGLSSSTRYFYAVSTFDDRGESPLSDVSAGSWPYTAPTTGRPQRVTGLAASEDSGTVVISWSPDVDPAVVGYYVTRADHSGDAGTTMTATPLMPREAGLWVDPAAVNGQTYFYRVFAVDSAGTVGVGSIEVRARPHSEDTGPDPHVVVTNGTGTSCTVCHAIHTAPSAGNPLGLIVGGPNEDSLCLSCHSLGSGRASFDTSSVVGDPYNRSRLPIWTPSSRTGSMTCGSCHRTVTNESSPTAGLIAAGDRGMTHIAGAGGDRACYICHGAASTLRYGDMTGFEVSAHSNVPDPASGSGVKCVACHDPHASRNTRLTIYADDMSCAQCHAASTPDPRAPDVIAKTQLNDGSDARHPLLAQDRATGARMTCQNCHNTHVATAANPLVNPHSPGPTGVWRGDLATDEKSFCFTCHDGEPLPTSAETSPWVGPVLGWSGATTAVDIKVAYGDNVHGAGVPSDPATAQANLRPDMGYAVGSVLECRACHDSHGSTNDFALNSSVTSANGATTLDGLLVYKIPAGSVTPTSPVGYDLRFFCSSCHILTPQTHAALAPSDVVDLNRFPVDCTRCHKHMNASRTAGSTGL
jgi:predicted CXXCH cytochrome family protein